MLKERGLLMRQGTIVDATIIAAPPSTNKSKARGPEMHQTKSGNQWHFGMKANIGVDVASGVVHTVAAPKLECRFATIRFHPLCKPPSGHRDAPLRLIVLPYSRSAAHRGSCDVDIFGYIRALQENFSYVCNPMRTTQPDII